ncbi:MAG: molybdenum cofactor guanylyltransferase [Planctomycetota bacterium]
MNVSLAGIILAGGENRRIGKNKAFLKIGNKTFLDILIDKLMPLFSEIIISVKSIKEFIGSTPSKYHLTKNVQLIQDILPIRSSLIGIYSALRSMQSDYGFVIGCDMPSVPEKLISYLIKSRKGFDVVIPNGSNGLEPLCALYSKRCLSPMEQLIKRRDFKIINFFPLASLSCPASQSRRSGEVKVKIINLLDIEKLNNYDIFNINTIEDLQHLRNSVKNTSKGKRSRKILAAKAQRH